MKPYLLSLGVGLLVGLIYSLLNVRSPAPPAIALVGLLGILIGEQALPYAKRLMHDDPGATAVHARAAQDAAQGHADSSSRPIDAHHDNAENRQP
ncbi:DUF1427 family protein [Paraburkholderia humisilvae]|uniref:XapX domain-containing protein n=1 Tax=Paraburkholderia humisilvae TaxID=627669 RepID=A0A6J5CX63_9BURK|nr:DUF1427 family protein [Paraburkholderia humisilvae]CAB3745741.1 hypothetical protein LMG29542_00032 [Paraburkholderia humisilvae]